MCGLVGVMGSEPKHNIPLFEHLLFVDVIRGMDSTGVAVVKRDLSFFIHKNVGTPDKVLFCPQFDKKLNKGEAPYVLMGHNRAATKGDVNLRNSHPFVHNNIILAHNGTLTWTNPLHSAHKENPFGTDSEAICYHLAHNTIEDTYWAIRGAAALSYWDRTTGSMNLVTNGQRPLHFALTRNRNNVYWASEAWMLEVLCARLRIPIEEVESAEKHTLYTFRWDSKQKQIGVEDKPLTPFSYPVTPLPPYRGSTFANGGTVGTGSKAVSPFFQNREWDVGSKQHYIWVQGERRFLFSGVSTKPEEKVQETETPVENRLAKSRLDRWPECAWCSSPFDLETVKDAVYAGQFEALICKTCSDNPEVQQLIY